MGNGVVKPKHKAQILNCSICFNLFKVPRMLPCQHTFCEACLQAYISKTMAHEKEKLDFPCPVCREPTAPTTAGKPRERWAKLFPKNRLILSLFDDDPQKSEGCRLHPGKIIEFYCENHVEIGCSTCLMTRHKPCELTPLETFIKSGKFKRSCQKNNDLLQQYKKLFEDMVVSIGKNLDDLEEGKVALIDEVKETRVNIDTLLNTLEEKVINAINENYLRECEVLNEQTSRCRKVILDVSNTIEQVGAAQTDINMVQKAEIIVSVEDKLSNFGTHIRQEYTSCKRTNMNVIYDPLIKQLQAELEDFAKIHVEKLDPNLKMPSFIPKSLIKEPPDVKRHKSKHVAKVGEFSVSGEDESFFCNITSTVVLQDGRIILADDSNCKLKMMDGRFRLKSELKLESNPLNIALVSEKELAVSLPGKREVAFVDIDTADMSLERTFTTRLDCWGLAVINKTIVVTTGRDGHSVILLDMEGNETSSFLLTLHTDENIRCPVSVTADKEREWLYVTCTGGAWSKGCVVCLDMTGKLMNIFYDPDIDTPRSCMLDKHGKLYICGLESSTVYQMSERGDVFRVFPAKTEQVVGPLHLNFVKYYHIRFLVTEVASDMMKVYELPTTKQ